MKHSKFLMLSFWFLTLIPFYNGSALSSEQASNIPKIDVNSFEKNNGDDLQAFHWFKAAAEQNIVKAQYRLGEICKEEEIIVKNDLRVIITWLESLKNNWIFVKGNLEKEEINKAVTYLRSQLTYVTTEEYDKNEYREKVLPLAQKYREIWDHCPEQKDIEVLTSLKGDREFNVTSQPNPDLKIIIDAKINFMKAFSAFDKENFMVTCIKPATADLEEQMKNSPYIRSYTHNLITYYTFHPLFVKKVDLMMAFMNPEAPWRKSKDNLLQWHQNLLSNWQASKTDGLHVDELLDGLHKNINFFQDLEEMPALFSTLLERFLPLRNQKFINIYSYFEDERWEAIKTKIFQVDDSLNSDADSDEDSDSQEKGVILMFSPNQMFIPNQTKSKKLADWDT